MKKINKTHIFASSILLIICLVVVSVTSLHKPAINSDEPVSYTRLLADTLSKIVSDYPAEIGVAVIIDNADTITANNKSIYPMMSVFKVHQALAVCNYLDRKGLSLDTPMTLRRRDLDPRTWSPMLKEHAEPEFSLTVKELLHYTLVESDNNASNFMFEKLVDAARTDSFIATVIPRSSFRIAYTEEEMSTDHDRAYSNYTSPLGAAILMNRLFTDSLVDCEKQCFIMNSLKECSTGKDRIVEPLFDKNGIVVAHKTGSGYTDENGVLAACNDVAYICLPDNVCYTLAVFVKDFKGDEAQAAKVISHISAEVYSLLTRTSEQS